MWSRGRHLPSRCSSVVTEELCKLLDVNMMRTVRFEPDGTATVLAAHGVSQDLICRAPNIRLPQGTVIDQVFRTGCPARVDHYARSVDRSVSSCGQRGFAQRPREGRSSSTAGCGAPWRAGSQTILPSGTEHRVTQFAELVSTAISNLESRAHVERLAAEQSALRRVATLVAREHSPRELFTTLVEELGVLLEVDATAILQYETDSSATVIAGWSNGAITLPVGARLPLEGENLASEVRGTGKARRKEDYEAASGPIAATVRELGIRSAVASPIVVEGARWGVIAVLSCQLEPLPPDTEARIAEFTRQAGLAVANAKSRSDLADSRARIVRPETTRAGASNAICTMVPNSGWCR